MNTNKMCFIVWFYPRDHTEVTQIYNNTAEETLKRHTQRYHFMLNLLFSDSEILNGENKDDLLCSAECRP